MNRNEDYTSVYIILYTLEYIFKTNVSKHERRGKKEEKNVKLTSSQIDEAVTNIVCNDNISGSGYRFTLNNYQKVKLHDYCLDYICSYMCSLCDL